MARERTFPIAFEERKPVHFYPAPVEELSGDILEIGPGRGDLLLWYAATYPNKQCVGIELAGMRYRKLVSRIQKRRLTNVTLLRGNARILVPRLCKTPCFERIYVLFPDPWPKDRHSFHRLLSVEFLIQLTAVLKPDGDVVLATDVQPYADWVIANSSHVESLQNTGSPYASPFPLIPNGEPTFFEKKWRDEGRSVFYVRLVKRR